MKTKERSVIGICKMDLIAGRANPSPPIGPALGQYGVNIMDFCKAFNYATSGSIGHKLSVTVTIYKNRTFKFKVKTPNTSYLLKKAAEIYKGANMPGKERVASISHEQLKEIALIKMPDLNANDINGAMNIIAGTARSMGIGIVQ